MSVTDEPPLAWLRKALEQFAVRDARLLDLGAGETALTARLAHHLTAFVASWWDVDAEYDRQGEAWARKLRDRHGGPSRDKLRYMRPDVAVHVRGEPGPDFNLMAVEVKRQWTSNDGDVDDLDKARQALLRIGYRFGVVLGLQRAVPRRSELGEPAPRHSFDPTWTVFGLDPSTHSTTAPEHYGIATRLLQAQAVFQPVALETSCRRPTMRTGAEEIASSSRATATCTADLTFTSAGS